MNNLKKIREEKKLTLRELSERTSIDYTTLSRIENNIRGMNDQHITILTSFFNVSSDYLLGLTNEASTTIKDNSFQFALSGEVEDLTDEQIEEIKRFAEYVKNRDKK